MNAPNTAGNSLRFLIVSPDGEIRLENLERDARGSLLSALQSAVGGYIEASCIDTDSTLYVHETGFFTEAPNPVASLMASVLGSPGRFVYGTAVITGGIDGDGNDLPITDARSDLLTHIGGWAMAQDDVIATLRDEALAYAGR